MAHRTGAGPRRPEFEWNEANEERLLDLHNVSVSEAEQCFANLHDARRKEADLVLLGTTDFGRWLHSVYEQKHDGVVRVYHARHERQREAHLPAEVPAMSDTRERDVEAEWEGLPEAPPLAARGKTAQITLRLPAALLAQIKLIANARSVPYHTLARSWLIEGLQRTDPPAPEEPAQPQNERLNVKLEQTVLDEIKERADQLRRPYHRLAREWVQEGLAREQQRMSADPAQDGETTGQAAERAASPYATGGGGVTFEHRVAARYLALMLTGNTSPELIDGRVITSIAFQQAPDSPVDDLVLHASRPGEQTPSLKIAVGVRRSPKLVPSDEDTQKLLGSYVEALLADPEQGVEQRLALVDAGTRTDRVSSPNSLPWPLSRRTRRASTR
jgi:predicted DNA binding CopG/RHH family protein/uncharacterized DUF497 family protein